MHQDWTFFANNILNNSKASLLALVIDSVKNIYWDMKRATLLLYGVRLKLAPTSQYCKERWGKVNKEVNEIYEDWSRSWHSRLQRLSCSEKQYIPCSTKRGITCNVWVWQDKFILSASGLRWELLDPLSQSWVTGTSRKYWYRWGTKLSIRENLTE